MLAITVPLVVIPLTATLYVVPLFGAISVTPAVVAPAVPLSITSAEVKPVTAPLKTTVKLIGLVLVGSVCPDAWLIVQLVWPVTPLIFSGGGTGPIAAW